VHAWAPRSNSQPPPTSWNTSSNATPRLETVYIAQVSGLWYGAFHTRPVRLLLIRDPGSTKPYDLAQVTTDLTTPPVGIVTRYSWRWGIEVLFAQLKQVLAAGEARNRVQRAVERTVPFCLAVYHGSCSS
jgi:hypothetical protein